MVVLLLGIFVVTYCCYMSYILREKYNFGPNLDFQGYPCAFTRFKQCHYL